MELMSWGELRWRTSLLLQIFILEFRVKCTVGTWTCSAVSNRSINLETGHLAPRTCEPVHPRSSPVLHGLHGTVRPRFATVNPDLLQLPRFCFFFSNLFRLNLWKIITLRYNIGWRWFLYENCSPRRDLQLSSFEFFHLMKLSCPKKLYKSTAP
jgi:hypothetical protein